MKKIILLILIFLISCQKSEINEIKYVKQNFLQGHTKQLYLFIPEEACHGCVTNLIYHLNLIEKPNIHIILIGKTKRSLQSIAKNFSPFYKIKFERKDPYLLTLTTVRILIYKPGIGFKIYTFEGNNDYSIIDTIDEF